MNKENKPVNNGITGKHNSVGGFLGWVERVGNKLPHPFWMFVWICVIIVLTSSLTALLNVRATDPETGEIVAAQNLFSGQGLRMFLEHMVTNFAHFAPFGLVLVMLMGVSVAEKTGLLPSMFRSLAFSVPRRIIFPVIFILAACANIGSDAGIVIMPPIAALIFAQMGMNPIAGLIAGYAGATAGFTANFFIAGTDVLLAGISSEITAQTTHLKEVSATANWYFMIASTLMIGIGGTFVVKRFTLPRMSAFEISADAMDQNLSNQVLSASPEEKRGKRNAGIAFLAYLVLISILVIPSWAPLRDPETGGLVPSPFLRGLVPILFFAFAIPGYFYGKAVGTIKKPNDILKLMEQGMKDLSGYIVLMLVVAQFINFFAWSNLDTILAIKGAEFLKLIGLTGPVMIVLFIIMVAVVNIFIGSGSAKWAIFAPIFIPMLAQLNYSPAFVQLIYRIGDSITNSVSPLYVYFPLLLGWIHKYNKNMGIGTVISLLLPYTITLFVLWIVLILAWYYLGLPIGVGETIYLE